MRQLATVTGALVVAVLLQTALPDRGVWHAGWYSVALLALAVLLVLAARHTLHSDSVVRPLSVWTMACGGVVLAFAGIASGLFAPGPQLIVGAPGVSATIAGLGDVLFPPLESGGPPALALADRAPEPIATQRYVGSFTVRNVPRTVLRVQAYTPAGAQLTVTQPTGSAFSSPVLLMRQTQTISGLTLPFDSFAVPAAHRIVKVVLFNASQVALMRGISGPPSPVILFAVDDAMDQPLPHAIAMARSEQAIEVGGLRLRATVAHYSAVDVFSVPALVAVVAGLVMIATGIALSLARIRTP